MKEMKEIDYTREEVHEMFRDVLNIVKPEHPYSDNPYPIRESEMYTTWKRGDSGAWAHCGPCDYWKGNLVAFAVDIGYFNNSSTERILCIFNHELTHIEEGSHTHGSTHNPDFWNAVVRNAKNIIDQKSKIQAIVGDFDTKEFISEVCDEPNNLMTDGRMETPEERKKKMRQELGGYRG